MIVRTLGERLPIMQWDIADRGGVFALVGPTGVGKTTTIAKIAARFVLRHSVDELGLVSTDSYRVGARQQLLNFARILRAPMQVADSATELARVLDGFALDGYCETAELSERSVGPVRRRRARPAPGHRRSMTASGSEDQRYRSRTSAVAESTDVVTPTRSCRVACW